MSPLKKETFPNREDLKNGFNSSKLPENTGSTSHTQQDLYGISREIKPSPLKRTPVCPKKRTKKNYKKNTLSKGS